MNFVTILVLSVGVYVASADHGWSYDGETGPDHWGNINVGEQNQCWGRKQSPINIDVTKTRYDRSLASLKLKNYEQITQNITIVNNGHSIQLISPSFQQSISGGPLSGTYDLLQMHLHWGKDSYRGSEHTVNGKRYPMELHMVHKEAGKPGRPASGKLAVLGVFFDVTKGKSNVGLQKISKVIKSMKTNDAIVLENGISPSLLLPNSKDFFTYEGSLTTPPCSEVVTWLVLKEPLKINERELEIFRSTLYEQGKPMGDNFRPVQGLNNRQVMSSFVTVSS